jgi:hypothetical protein
MNRSTWILSGLVTVLLAALLAGCGTADEESGSSAIALDGATSATARIEMGAGKLTVRGGADPANIVDADYTYSADRLKPDFDYSVTDGAGTLTVDNSGGSGINLGTPDADWDLRLSEALPLDLKIELGAGKSDLQLGGLDLTALVIETGVGQATVDLTGDWARDLHVTVDAGVGDLTLKLPSRAGVRVDTDTGLTSTDVDGLEKQDGAWVNAAYGTSDVTLTVDLELGVGDVDLEVVE